MMKKLLLVVFAATAFTSVEAGFFGKSSRCGSSCAPRKQNCVEECAPKNCLREVRVIDCTNNICEGEIPQLCALEPARVDVIKHVNTTVNYTCAGPKGCQVVPTQEQVDQLIAGGHIPADTRPCSSR